MLDAYDRAYERALRSVPGSGRQELVAIQDTVSLWGRPAIQKRATREQPPRASWPGAELRARVMDATAGQGAGQSAPVFLGPGRPGF